MNEELNLQLEPEVGVSRPVAPGALRPGDYITAVLVLSEESAAPWERDVGHPAVSRALRLPDTVAPTCVLEVCLPFVLVQTAQGKARVLDVRRYRLARVSETFGQRVFARLAEDRKAEQAGGNGEERLTAE